MAFNSNTGNVTGSTINGSSSGAITGGGIDGATITTLKQEIVSYVLDQIDEVDPVFSSSPAANIEGQDIINWNAKPTTYYITNNYYNKSEIDEKLVDLATGGDISLDGYATLSYVQQNCAPISTTNDRFDSVDEDIEALEQNKQDKVTGTIATQEWIANQNYAKQSDIPSVSNFVTYSYLNEKNYLTQHQDLSAYASKLYAEQYTDDKIAALGIENYATTSWVTNRLTYIATNGTVSLDGYATEEWVEGKNYLTQHQSLDNYYTKSQVDAKLINSGTNVDLSDYAKLSDIPDLSSYAKKSELPDLSGYAKTSDLANIYTKNEVNQIITENEQTQAQALADMKSEIQNEMPSLDGYASQDWVDENFFAKDDISDLNNCTIIRVTQSEYDALPDSDKNDPTKFYVITDATATIPEDYSELQTAVTNMQTTVSNMGTTVSNLQVAVSGKQDAISDLGEIRTKANSAVQIESDPVFKASPAYNITQADITRWNSGTGTGIATETDPIFKASVAYNLTQADLTKLRNISSGSNYDDSALKTRVKAIEDDYVKHSEISGLASKDYVAGKYVNQTDLNVKMNAMFRYDSATKTLYITSL